MVQIAALLFAAPLGYFCKTRRQGLAFYGLLTAVLLPIQTLWILSDSPDDVNVGYWVIQVLTLAVGLGLNALCARLRERPAGLVNGASS
jgi:hypothetical protein